MTISPAFKLTPNAQEHYDASQRAAKEGKVYRDDIGQCWPAGMPLIMTRVWPIAMVQLPTVIYMTSAFMNSMRIVYLDGRPHSDPDIVVRTFNGESIGHWDGSTLVVDTQYFVDDHHWMDQGGSSIPASDQLHIIERIRLVREPVDPSDQRTDRSTCRWPNQWLGSVFQRASDGWHLLSMAVGTRRGRRHNRRPGHFGNHCHLDQAPPDCAFCGRIPQSRCGRAGG